MSLFNMFVNKVNKNKPKKKISVELFQKHQEYLQEFLKNRTSIGMNGSAEDLNNATNAMYFFSRFKLKDYMEIFENENNKE